MKNKIFRFIWKILNKYFSTNIRKEFNMWKRIEENPIKPVFKFGAESFHKEHAKIIISTTAV